MLSRAREGRLRAFRGALAAGWLLLIISLFWDPVTPQLTDPANSASPFHIHPERHVYVQGSALVQEPYAMTNRVFWTMLIPVLPLFFMVAGHEAWRRICPLSFFSQIPRYLGRQRKRPVLDRKSGKVSRLLALVPRGGWLARNVWYVQFGLLFLGLNARLLFVNSDRTALAVFLIGIIVAAMVVGALFGGKTWCNFVCPVAIVQKIYTQPRGLLESSAHIERIPISQSMCRAPGKDADRSICVGCTPSCPDIDLERAHWDTVADSTRRNVYYGFFGLVLGFYSFYYVYSGNWDYYFSGAWTHEADQLAALFAPGVYVAGRALPIPKILSAPLVLGAFVAIAMLLGRILEGAYARLRTAIGKPLTQPELLSQCLAFSAYVTINTFYLFGGRPNLSLLPSPALRAVDILIVALSTLWFWQSVQRSPVRYRREGLASSLREQLRALKLDISRFIEDRKLDELKPDEVYVLAKTLPQFSREQKLGAYRNILHDALQQGRTNSAASLEMLREVRTELSVSDEEHRQLMEEFGARADQALDPGQAATYENWIRLSNYRHAVEAVIIPQLEHGLALASALHLDEVEDAISRNREFYRITQEEHDSVLAQITGSGGMIFEKAKALLPALCRLASLKLGLSAAMPRDSDSIALAKLLGKVLQERAGALLARQFSALLALGNSAESFWLCENIAHVVGDDIEVALQQQVAAGNALTWEQSLSPDIVLVLRGGKAPDTPPAKEPLPAALSYRRVIDDCLDLQGNLAKLAGEPSPHVQALALTALSYLDVARARELATSLEQGGAARHWLLRETLYTIVGSGRSGEETARGQDLVKITVASPNAPSQTYSIAKPYITIGRDPANDVVVPHPSVAPFHFGLSVMEGAVELRRVDMAVETYVDDIAVAEPVALRSGARISVSTATGGPTILVNVPARGASHFSVQRYDTMTKMVWLSGVPVFEHLDLDGLADVAQTAEVRVYAKGAWLCRAGEPSSEAFMLQSGEMEVFSGADKRRIGCLVAGAIVGEIGVITQRPRAASVRVATTAARVLAMNGESIRRIIRRNASVSAGMLVGVAQYIAGAQSSNEAQSLETAA